MFTSITCVGMLACLLLTGCAKFSEKGLKVEQSVVTGLIQITSSEPYFRKYQTEPALRFLDVLNSQTGDWTRIHVNAKEDEFLSKLVPGRYELVRLQIGEGPFRSECQVSIIFDVPPGKIVHLGIWRFVLDSPQTVRMLRWEVLDEVSSRDLLVAASPNLAEMPMVVSPLSPTSGRTRLFAVAPSQPRAKYFYRR